MDWNSASLNSNPFNQAQLRSRKKGSIRERSVNFGFARTDATPRRGVRCHSKSTTRQATTGGRGAIPDWRAETEARSLAGFLGGFWREKKPGRWAVRFSGGWGFLMTKWL